MCTVVRFVRNGSTIRQARDLSKLQSIASIIHGGSIETASLRECHCAGVTLDARIDFTGKLPVPDTFTALSGRSTRHLQAVP